MIDGYTYKRLEQALEELEVLRAETKVLKQKLAKATLILKKIKKLMEMRSAKKGIYQVR